MKVIFLDHDGVICLSTEWGSRSKKRKKFISEIDSTENLPVEYRFDNFNQKAVRILNQILEETGAEIVVSSDWRYHANLEEMCEYYLSQGVIKGPIDFTPKTNEIDTKDWLENSYSLESERAFEIKCWLANPGKVSKWVAVDDLNMSNFLDNFVLTPKSSEGIKQTGVKEKIINFL